MCSSPGFIETNIIESAGIKLPPEIIKKINDKLVSSTPLKRAGEPLDIAKGIVFLSSSDAQFITGANLVIDGGAIYNIPSNILSTLSNP